MPIKYYIARYHVFSQIIVSVLASLITWFLLTNHIVFAETIIWGINDERPAQIKEEVIYQITERLNSDGMTDALQLTPVSPQTPHISTIESRRLFWLPEYQHCLRNGLIYHRPLPLQPGQIEPYSLELARCETHKFLCANRPIAFSSLYMNKLIPPRHSFSHKEIFVAIRDLTADYNQYVLDRFTYSHYYASMAQGYEMCKCNDRYVINSLQQSIDNLKEEFYARGHTLTRFKERHITLACVMKDPSTSSWLDNRMQYNRILSMGVSILNNYTLLPAIYKQQLTELLTTMIFLDISLSTGSIDQINVNIHDYDSYLRIACDIWKGYRYF